MQNETIEALDGVVAWWINNDNVAYTCFRDFSLFTILGTTQWFDIVFY